MISKNKMENFGLAIANFSLDKLNLEDTNLPDEVFYSNLPICVIDAIDMLLWFTRTYDAFYVSFDQNYSGVYEDETITIYGIVKGNYCYNTQAGGTNCVPLIIGQWFEK